MRLATRTSHAEIEASLPKPGNWTASALVAYLRATFAVVHAAEQGLRQHLDLASFPLLADATARLRHDLALMESAPAESIAPMDGAAVADRSDAFGGSYVILGSQLGGQIIRTALVHDLGTAADGLSYFARPEHVGSAWASFTDALNRWGSNASDDVNDGAIRAASRFFRAFARGFRREGMYGR